MDSIVIAATVDEAGANVAGTAIRVTHQGLQRLPMSVFPVSPDFREAAKWFGDHAGRDFLGGFGLHLPSRRGYLLVDASHRVYGMPFAQALADCQGRRKWSPSFAAVVEVEADLVVPERSDGVRTKIGRGALVSALTDAVKNKLIGIGKSEAELRAEWDAYNRGVSAGEKQAPMRVQALKLAAWGAMRLWRAEQAGRPGRAV